MRAILKLKCGYNQNMKSIVEGGGTGDYVPTYNKNRQFQDLLSHKNDFLKNQEKKEGLKIIYSELEDFLDDQMPDFDEFMEVIGRLYINGFEIHDENMETYGWGIFLGPSIMDHSCQPTAEVSFTGNMLTVTSIKDVEDLSEVFISYCDSTHPTQIRQEKLYSDYFFMCACCKCSHSAHHGKSHSGQNNKNSPKKKNHKKK